MPDVWTETGEYFDSVSVFGNMPIIAALLAIVDMTLTFVHGNQERRDQLWRYFGAIYGFRFPNWLGLPVFFVSLTLILWVVAIVGILGACTWNGSRMQELGVAAVGILIGGRLADSWNSHIALSRKGYRPNPGLASVPIYIAEAVVLAAIFAPGLIHDPYAALLGIAVGAVFFWLLVPSFLRLLAAVFPRHQPWIAGQPMPNWARED
jgi:hypothetical protein